MSESAVQIRYREFVRRTGRTESSDSVREFLHLEILRVLSAQNIPDLILHGGCKTRYIDGSPRYSMDMYFSLSPFIDLSREERSEAVDRSIDPLIQQLRDLYDLDGYINRGVRVDLAVARTRLHMPDLSHEELVQLLCKRVETLDIKKRIHQIHLPTESERTAFIDPAARISTIKRMQIIP